MCYNKLLFFGGGKMKIVICDDDKNCIDDVVKLIDEYSNENSIKFEKYIYSSSKQVIENNENYDIAVLDVEMPGVDGIELGKKLRKRNSQIVLIYLTAHSQYLDSALNLNAARFFEKPIDKERFFKGLDNALERIDNTTVNFFIREDKSQVRITADSIIYIEIEKRKTRLVTTERAYSTTYTIDYFKNRLLSSVFATPHKSYIVNFNYVTQYERDKIQLAGKYISPVSKSKQTAFRKAFIRFLEGK